MDRRPENPPEDAALTKAEKFSGGCLLWARADGRDAVTKQLIDSNEDGMVQSTPTTLPYLRGQVAMLPVRGKVDVINTVSGKVGGDQEA